VTKDASNVLYLCLKSLATHATNRTKKMGAAASVQSIAGDLKLFVNCFAPLTGKGDASKAVRKQSWLAVDPNGNGLVSLAEFDGWIKKSLMLNLEPDNDTADRLWKLYRPSYIRAFNDAKDIGKERPVKSTTSATGDTITTEDYITKGEFRLANAYLCLYAAMFDAFALLDGGSEGTTATDDRRVSLEEFTKGMPAVVAKKYGFVALSEVGDNAEATFKKIDADGKGMVLLNEWCKWIEKAEQDAGTDYGKMLAAGDDDQPAAAAPAADGGGEKK